MFPEFVDFKVEIRDQELTTESGLTYPQTAVLTFITTEGHLESVIRLGYLTEEDIFGIIQRGDDLQIDHCYIDNLSLPNYRELHKLDRKETITLKNLSARSSFFNSKSPIDLSYAEISGDLVSFEESRFAKGSFSLHSSRITGGGLDFSHAHLPEGAFDMTNLKVEQGDISFKNAVFGEGLIDFQDAEFGEGTILFTNTDFGDGDVSFINTQFGDGNVSFKVARFGTGKVDFHYAKFREGDISFERTDFGDGRVDFRTAEFMNGRVNFNRSVFGDGDVSFEASEIKKGKISFKRTVFGQGVLDFELAEYDDADVTFDRAVFDVGIVSFHNARFKTLSLQSCHFDHYLDLRVAKCHHIDLSDTICRDIVDIMPYEFDLDIGTIDFSGMRLIGRIYIDWTLNRVKKLIRDQKETNNRSKAEQFRTLKENFSVTGQYNAEDLAYLEFKRLESIAELEESIAKKPVSAFWMYPAYWFKLIIFDWVGHYATNPVRVIISMMVMYTIFSVMFMLLTWFTPADIVSSLGDPDKLNVVVRSFYHCAITFLTIGYGDYYPSGFIRWFSSFVGFAGLVMVAYFTVAFVRKILR
ncbi:MAG TPA: two pore domain potassium channel family protein [Bacteroides sp.]|nr:two pore domain potassium channel family protein [Bacteroides sp.]